MKQIIVCAIVGNGLAVAGRDGVSPRKRGVAVLALFGPFVLAFGLGYGTPVAVG